MKMLKSWNDIEGYNFERVPEQSYFKVDDSFPNPICSKKMTNPVYHQNLNDKYICISTGSENKNCRNTNVENIYKAEDKLYEFDMQIDNIARSLQILGQEIKVFEALPPDQQGKFQLSAQKFSPLRYHWDKKSRGKILDDFLAEGRTLTKKDLMKMKEIFNERHEYLKNLKKQSLGELKD